MDRLGRLDDAVVGEVPNDSLAELLDASPQVAQVASPAQDDDPAADLPGHRLVGIGGCLANVPDLVQAEVTQIRHLRCPDHAVSDIRADRKVNQRYRLGVGKEWAKGRVYLGAQPTDELYGRQVVLRYHVLGLLAATTNRAHVRDAITALLGANRLPPPRSAEHRGHD